MTGKCPGQSLSELSGGQPTIILPPSLAVFNRFFWRNISYKSAKYLEQWDHTSLSLLAGTQSTISSPRKVVLAGGKIPGQFWQESTTSPPLGKLWTVLETGQQFPLQIYIWLQRNCWPFFLRNSQECLHGKTVNIFSHQKRLFSPVGKTAKNFPFGIGHDLKYIHGYQASWATLLRC